MADQPNFLLGFGERLTEPIPPPGRVMEKPAPYAVLEARDRLAPMVAATSQELDSLPHTACPRDEAVAVITLHPEYLAKSYYPGRLLRAIGLETVGSRPRRVRPEKTTRKKGPVEEESTELFVAGPRERFRSWAGSLGQWSGMIDGAYDLPKIETFRALTVDDRLRPIPGDTPQPLLEIALHAGPRQDYIVDAFRRYVEALEMEADLERRFYAGGLCFMPLRARRDALEQLGRFSFLRVARIMPRLRPLHPVVRSWSGPSSFPVKLPDGGPLDSGLHAAVFDGGMPEVAGLDQWVRAQDVEGVGTAIDEYLQHGANVTSAVLFGPLCDSAVLERPFSVVDHYRVLDETSGQDEDLYEVLRRVRSVLQNNAYEFVNLSIGPEIPIEDDDVHVWTAVLDELLGDGKTLAVIAAGNGGDRDAVKGFNRVQVPGDCVNGLTVGSADIQGTDWRRAMHSSVGPGRSPGVVKPDVLAFGGSEREPFWVVNADSPTESRQVAGTSFATPAALRVGLGIRAHFGDVLSPLAIKALLVHCAEDGVVPRQEGGWGRIPSLLDSFVVCPIGHARIVYQGELTAGQYLRAKIPVPVEPLQGNVTIRATLCYTTKTDAHHPGNYTRAGIDVVFRPHDGIFDPKSEDPSNPKSDPFFRLKEFSSEKELRRDAHKWETTLHREKKKRGSSLSNPVLDIHYNARQESGPTQAGERIRYALIITVVSRRTKDLYDRIVRRYPTQLRPLLPVVQIPVRTAS